MSGKIVRLVPKQMTLDDLVARALQGMVRKEKLSSLTEAWDVLMESAYINAAFDMNALTQATIDISRVFAGATLRTKVIVPSGKTLESAMPRDIERSWAETLQRLEQVKRQSGISAGLF